MQCPPPRECARAGGTQEPFSFSPSRHTHVPAGERTVHTRGCTRAHIHTRVRSERQPCLHHSPLLSLCGDSFQVPLPHSSGLQGERSCLPAPGTFSLRRHSSPPPAQTVSWRNKCLCMARASPTPETPARSASVRKAMPAASLGPAPSPPVPTRCLVPAAAITAMVRQTGRGGRLLGWLAPSVGI